MGEPSTEMVNGWVLESVDFEPISMISVLFPLSFRRLSDIQLLIA